MPLLNVVLVPGPDQVVVRPTGEIDLSSTGLLADALAQAGAIGTTAVVVDVAGAVFWDCSGLHALAAFTVDLARAGRRCRIAGATAATRRLVVLAGFAPDLALDGPVHLPAVVTSPSVAAPGDAARRAPGATVRTAARRPPPVVPHLLPARRRLAGPPEEPGSVLTMRRWR